ncbi:MAG: hypothetical protein RIB47_06565 [Cyclobacteriaceae bacterium]
MKNITLLLLAGILLLSCSKSAEEILPENSVITSSGNRISMDGSWTASCVSSGSRFLSETFTISSKTIALDIEMFNTAGCSGLPDEMESLDMSFEVGDTYQVTLNGVQVTANKISGIATSSSSGIPEPFKQAFYIDDASGSPVLYHGIFGDDGGKLSPDGYPIELHNIAIARD